MTYATEELNLILFWGEIRILTKSEQAENDSVMEKVEVVVPG